MKLTATVACGPGIARLLHAARLDGVRAITDRLIETSMLPAYSQCHAVMKPQNSAEKSPAFPSCRKALKFDGPSTARAASLLILTGVQSVHSLLEERAERGNVHVAEG